MLKKILAFTMALGMLFSFTACKNAEDDGSYYYETSTWEETVDASEGESNNQNTENSSQGATSNSNSGAAANNSTAGAVTNNASKVDLSKLKLANKVTIKEGTSAVDANVNFGGKTITMAITNEGQFHDAKFTRMVAAFEKKFNCKIKTTELAFGTYNTQIQQALSAGTSYDICFQHYSMYPVGIKDGLYADMSKVITTADLQDPSNKSAGGIDLENSSYFAYGGKLYGLSHYYSEYPAVMYYNKKLCSAAGIDPLKLYNEGKWTWTTIASLGKKVTNANKGVYFMSQASPFTGEPEMDIVDGTPVCNVGSSKYIDALTQKYKFSTGANQFMHWPYSVSEVQAKYDYFKSGKYYVLCEELVKWSQVAADAKSSTAFDKSLKNLGVVPVPTTGTNSYPFCGRRAVCAGVKSSDLRAAACWAKFEATYVDAVNDPATVVTGDIKKITDPLYEKTHVSSFGCYYTSDNDTITYLFEMGVKVAQGGDIAQLVKQAKNYCDQAIKQTWK